MINETHFKKILNIFKTNSDDLNTEVVLLDYDTSSECDYETLTLHFRETNKNNGVSVYKDLVIRSQLYYNSSTELYYSALDGDVIVQGGALCEINFLTNITDLKLSLESIDNVNIRVQLIDVDTQKPIKNQLLMLYTTSDINNSIASTRTDSNGIASFNVVVNKENIEAGENVLFVSFQGNNTYRATKSDYILINVESVSDVDNDITALIDSSGKLHMTYNISKNNKSLTDAYRDLSGLTEDQITNQEILDGDVLFYIDNQIVATSTLSKSGKKDAAAAIADFPQNLFDNNCIISAVFTGNKYFAPQKATTTLNISRIHLSDENIRLTLLNPTQNRYKVKLEFDIPLDYINEEIASEKGFLNMYPLRGRVSFYIQNKYGDYGTLYGGKPFLETSDFKMNSQTGQDYYTISANIENQVLKIDPSDYGLSEGINSIKAIYTGNTVVEGFSIIKQVE